MKDSAKSKATSECNPRKQKHFKCKNIANDIAKTFQKQKIANEIAKAIQMQKNAKSQINK